MQTGCKPRALRVVIMAQRRVTLTAIALVVHEPCDFPRCQPRSLAAWARAAGCVTGSGQFTDLGRSGRCLRSPRRLMFHQASNVPFMGTEGQRRGAGRYPSLRQT